jgi:DNA-binding MarR family transcriptional regulator
MYSFGNLDFSKLLNNISKSEYVVLSKIDEYIEMANIDYINVTKLSELMNVSVPAVSRVLKGLENKKTRFLYLVFFVVYINISL